MKYLVIMRVAKRVKLPVAFVAALGNMQMVRLAMFVREKVPLIATYAMASAK